MNQKNKIKEATIEASAKDIKALKATNAVDKDDVIKVIDDNNQKTTVTEDGSDEIKPISKIKFLSNIKDSKTGEVSKPFIIGDKKYQMVRGELPNKKIVVGVYCHDDKDDEGKNIIHPVDHFEKTIAKPILEKTKKDTSPSVDQNFIKHINLADLKNFKHFIVNIKTGDIIAKFKSVRDMVKSNKQLGPDEEYMTVKELKTFRIGNSLNNAKELQEEDDDFEGEMAEMSKVEADVAKLIDLITSKFSSSLAKINNPKEQAQFITRIAQEIGVPLNKLQSLVSNGINEAMERESLLENTNKRVIKTIKVKDIK